MKKWWPNSPDYEKILQAYVTLIGWEQQNELNMLFTDLSVSVLRLLLSP